MKFAPQARGMLLIAAWIMVGGLIIPASKFGAPCMALSAIFGSFVAGHTTTDIKAESETKDDEAV